jgi:hypothetical protein
MIPAARQSSTSEARAIVFPPMGETDITFRRLLRGLPRPILQLAFPRRRVEPVGPPIDTSLDRSRPRTGDNLFRVRTGGSKAAVHVEIEREWRSRMPRRLFEYASAAVVAMDLPVSSIVVLLRPGGRPPRGTGVYRIPGVSGNAFVFRYRVVSLWQLDARRMRAYLGPLGAPFCVAMRGADEAFVRSLAAEVRTTSELSERDRETTMQLLFLVTAVILGSETAKRIFHMESIIQDPNVQELIREWEDKGHAKGRAEGRAEEARANLYRVLALRSLPVTPDVRVRIDGEADIARIEAWHDAAVTAATIGDVFREG